MQENTKETNKREVLQAEKHLMPVHPPQNFVTDPRGKAGKLKSRSVSWFLHTERFQFICSLIASHSNLLKSNCNSLSMSEIEPYLWNKAH